MSDKLVIAAHLHDTVTIERDVYETLVATYKAYQQIGQAIGAMGKTPKLKPEDVATLDERMNVNSVHDMRRDGTVYVDVDGDHWRWNGNRLEIRETSQDEHDFHPCLCTNAKADDFGPFRPTQD